MDEKFNKNDVKQKKYVEKKYQGEEFKKEENNGNDTQSIEQNHLEVSYQKFIQDELIEKIALFRANKSCEFLEESEWNPLTELALEASEIPQLALGEWLNQHVERFISDFDSQNYDRRVPSDFSDPVRRNSSESLVTRFFCLSMVSIMMERCPFLDTEFQKRIYRFYPGYLPKEDQNSLPPKIVTKALILSIRHLEKTPNYPAIAVIPTGYVMYYNDYKALKKTMQIMSKLWNQFKVFYGAITNFRSTIFLKYNVEENKFYQSQYTVNFNECYLQKKSFEKLENFYRIWFALIKKALKTHQEVTE